MAHFAFVSYEVKPATPGGVGTFIAAIAAALLRDGHRVSLLLDISEDEFISWQKCTIVPASDRGRLTSFRVQEMCFSLGRQTGEFPAVAHWKSFQFAHCLRSLHARMPIDFAEFADYCGPAYYALVGRLAEPGAFPARIAVRLHNTIEMIDRRVGNEFQSYRAHDYALERAAIGLADMVLTPGIRYWQEEASSIYPIGAERVQSSFPVRAAVPFCADVQRGRDVIFIGRTSTLKGMDRMLAAARVALEDSTLEKLLRRFVLIGPNETVSSSLSAQEILSIAAGIPRDRLVFAGRLGETEIWSHFAEAAVAVFPNRIETFCYAAHEAHMAGVPLILSDIPAFRDHFTDGENAVFFDNTVPGLVEQLRRVLRDKGFRQRLSDSVRLRLVQYERHDYLRHLNGPSFSASSANEIDVASCDVSIIVVPLTGGLAQAWATGSVLAAALRSATVRLLAPAQRGAGLNAFGQVWTVHTLAGEIILAQAERLRTATVFIAAKNKVDPAFIARAVGMLQRERRIGAVVPGYLTPDGSWRTSDIPTTLDAAALDSVTIVSAVLATESQPSLMDLCADHSALTEIAALFRLRAAARILVDDPAPAISLGDAVIPCGITTQAGFLRRNAWLLDRTAAANTLASMTVLGEAIKIADINVIDSVGLLSDLEASRHTDNLVLHVVPGKDAEDDPGEVTLLTIRRAPGAMRVSWDEIVWSGVWESRTVWDRPTGMLVSRGGSLLCRSARDPEITLLRGPNQGEAVLLWHVRALRIRLTHERYDHVSLRVADLFALWPAADGGRPLRFEVADILNSTRLDMLVAALQGTVGRAVFVMDPEDVPLTENIGGFARATVVPEDLRHPLSRLCAAISLALARARAGSIALFGGEEWLPLLQSLLDENEKIRIALYLRPGISWSRGGWETLRAIAAAALRWGSRLTLYARSGAVHDALALLGIEPQPFELRIPSPSLRPLGDAVALVFAPAPSEIPAIGHLAAAAALAVQHGTPIAAIHVPEWQAQSSLMVERFGLGAKAYRYRATAEVISALRGRRFVYLAPFPDGAIHGAVLAAFAAGGLALTSAGCLDFADAELDEVLSVTLWEDAEVLAMHIAKAIARYDEMIRRLTTVGVEVPDDARCGARRAHP